MTAGLVISHYRVLQPLGKGGMGEVYRGFDETLRRYVALKAIRPERRLDHSAKARFLREARILSQLDHPHICRVYDYLETDDRAWLVLELVEGQTLRGAMERGLTAAARLQIAQQIAAVLVATHAADIVHRDLKAANVMLTTGGDVKVLDFGISATTRVDDTRPSKLPPEQESQAPADLEETRMPAGGVLHARPDALDVYHTEAGTIAGTVGSMSPEQARGEVATPASDMYSFGLLLQELFTGRPPYNTTLDYAAQLSRAQRGESLPPTGMSAELAALILRLKSLAPAQRPTAVDTLERLRWIGDAPSRRRRYATVAILLVAAIVGAAKYTWDLSRERTAAVAARQDADRRRDQAEDLISFMVGDLRSKLTAVGRLEILDDVGQKALAYFAAVPAQALTGEELYRRSQTMHQLGQVRQARGDFDGARQAFDESLAQAEDLVRRDPDNARWQLGLGTSHFYVGDLKRRRGDLDGALSHFRAYQRIAERLVAKDPDNADWTLELSYGHSNVAAILQQKGDLHGARAQLEIQSALQERLLQVKPGDAALHASRANNHSRLGIVLERLGDLPGAVEKFERELRIYAELSADDPANARAMRRVVVSRIYLGRTLRALGREDAALAQLRTAVQEARALVALDAVNADWQRDLAIASMWLGRLLVARSDTGASVDLFRGSIAMLEPLASRGGATAGARLDLARAREGFASALYGQGRFGEALREADEAIALVRPLLASAPSRDDAAIIGAMADNQRGLIWTATREPARARAAWTRSVEALTPLAAKAVDRELFDPLVQALVYLGRPAEAKPWVDRLMALGYRDRVFLELWKARGAPLPKTPTNE